MANPGTGNRTLGNMQFTASIKINNASPSNASTFTVTVTLTGSGLTSESGTAQLTYFLKIVGNTPANSGSRNDTISANVVDGWCQASKTYTITNTNIGAQITASLSNQGDGTKGPYFSYSGEGGYSGSTIVAQATPQWNPTPTPIPSVSPTSVLLNGRAYTSASSPLYIDPETVFQISWSGQTIGTNWSKYQVKVEYYSGNSLPGNQGGPWEYNYTNSSVSSMGDSFADTRRSNTYKITVVCYDGSTSKGAQTQAYVAINSYTVKYNANGGSSTPATQYKAYNKSVTLAAAIAKAATTSTTSATITTTYNVTTNNPGATNPTAKTSTVNTTKKTTFTFSKWRANGTSGTSYSASASYTTNASVTMYATFTASTTTSTAGTSFTLASIPAKTGYSVKGWYSAASGGTKIGNASAAYTPTASATIYAQYTANTYKVTLNANGGSGGTGSVTATYGSAMPAATMPTRANYSFLGYYDTNATSGGTQYYTSAGASARTWNKTSAATLYARWSQNAYVLTVNPMGGNWSGATANKTYNINPGSTQSIPAPTKAGYDFVGWASRSGAITQQVASVSGLFTAKPNLYVYSGAATTGLTIDLENNSYTSSYKQLSVTATTATLRGAGFHKTFVGTANTTYYVILEASAPIGTYFYIHNSEAYQGTGYTMESLTPMAGTGKWRTYIWKIKMGSSGIQGTGYIVLCGDKNQIDPTKSPAAYSNATINYKVRYYGVATAYGGAQTYNSGTRTTAETIFAIWTEKKYNIAYSLGTGGSMSEGTNKTANHTDPQVRQRNPLYSFYDRANYLGPGKSPSTDQLKLTANVNTPWISIQQPVQRTTTTITTDFVSNVPNMGVNSINSSSTITFPLSKWTITGLDNITHSYWDGAATQSVTGTSFSVTAASGSGSYGVPSLFQNLKNTAGTATFTAAYSNSGTATYSAITLPSISRYGYTFNGWYTANTGGTRVGGSGSSYTPTTSSTLYARWTGISYQVKFNANGGSGTMANQTGFVYGTAKALTSNTYTAPSGYTFVGWATTQARAAAGNRDYTNGATITEPGNIIVNGVLNLYAIWRRAITFYSGQSKATTNTVYQYYNNTAGGAITTPAPVTISGWTALGWRDDTAAGAKEYNANAAITPTTVTTYYAVYSATITFYHGYNKATTTTRTGYYNSNNTSTVTAPAITAITYWIANGWRDDTTAGAREYAVTTEASISGFGINKTFYAVYHQNPVMSYAGNGNTGGSTANTNGPTRYMNSGNTTLSNANVVWTLASNGFTKTGHTFSKWDLGNAGASYSVAVAYNASPNKTATAQWVGISYSVAFNANGGSGTMATQTGFTYGTGKALNSNTFTAPAGYTFYGWATTQARAAAGTRDYTDGGTMTTGTTTAGGTVTLYAMWNRTVNFYSGSSNAKNTTRTQWKNGSADGTVVAPTAADCQDISGWTELGWRADNSAANAAAAFGATITPTTTTYRAVYSRTATFYSGISKATSSTATQYYNSNNVYSVTTPAASACADITGWEKLGWRIDATATTATKSFGAVSTSSVNTFYAVYRRPLTLKHNGNGNTGGSTEDLVSYQYYNTNPNITTVTLTTRANGFTKDGYRFSKWAVDSVSGDQITAGTSVTFAPAVSDTVTIKNVYAIWLANTATVYYHVNGGTIPTGTDTTRWRATSDGYIEKSTNSGSTWERISYVITSGVTTNYDAYNVGTYGATKSGCYYGSATGDVINASYRVSNATSGTIISADNGNTNPNTVARLTGQTSGGIGIVPTHGSTYILYINWVAKATYTISYNANGGTGAPGNQTKTHGVNITLSTTKPARKGYWFAGWSTSNTAIDPTAAYNPGSTYSTNANLTLYAVWWKCAYIYDSTWKPAIPYIYDGSAWKRSEPWVYNGSAWG